MWGCWASAGYRIEWIMNRLLTSLVLKVSLVPSEVSEWKELAEAPQHSLIYCVRQQAALLCVVAVAPCGLHTHASFRDYKTCGRLPARQHLFHSPRLWPDDSEILTRLTKYMQSLILRFWHSTQSGQMSLRRPLPSTCKCQALANQQSTSLPWTWTTGRRPDEPLLNAIFASFKLSCQLF